ncbi:MAG: hypothetical protein IJF07_07695 [Lachnospiraceae bacterium]|nr:hypothetical protein [Lachnospiraceae bacterium]
MKMVLLIAKVAMAIWFLLIIVMLPTYFVRKKHNPGDNKNTIKNLVLKALLASVIVTIIFCSGLIAMYIEEVK